MTDEDARPGYAKILSTDDTATIERKVRTAFAPVRVMKEAAGRVNDPKHRWRDPDTGRFVKRTR